MGNVISSPTQRDMVERSRAECCLDRSIPLGFSPAGRPEIGPSAPQYYRAKAARGESARFWLHQTAHPARTSR
jgi:hypothetical protein